MADQDELKPRRLNIDDEALRYPIEKMTRGGRRRRPGAQDLHEQSGRMPPQAVDVEQSVLGAMLIEREAIPRAVEVLSEDAFYTSKHYKIYLAITSLFERGNPVDLITLTEELKRRGELEEVGGAYYLTELTTKVASAANVEYHARIIAEKSLLRKMIETMTGIIGKAYDPGSDAFDLLDQAESDIFRISAANLRKSASSMNEVLKETLARLEAIHGRTGGITGVPSGFPRLDDMTGGWQRSDLVIIAARPSMGKTAFALATARNAALHPEHPTGVTIFSLEMSAQQLAQRLLTSEARVDAQSARTGRLSEEDWPRLARAAGRLSAAPIYIDDTPGLSILELRAKCRRLKAEHDIGLVIVDYLQLMHGTMNARNANREQEIAQISRSLKSLAKEIDVPVIALSQLSRAVETRGGDKRPQLSDLRESGCLAGDTLVMLADSGRRVPIRDLAARYPDGGFRVWSLDPETLELEATPVSRAFPTGTKPTFRLATRLGRTVRATANHKFLTVEGWKRLDELSEGEHLALPRHIPPPEKATLDELALLGHLHEKRVPEAVFEQPGEHVAHFLRHLWATDGCIRVSGQARPYPAVYYASSSPRLARDVQALLLRLGINAWLARIPQRRKGRDQYHVTVSGQPDLLRFCDTVGAVGRYRAEALAEVRSAGLARLAQSDLYWDEIVGIEPDGVEEVFDLTVPGPHNFVADDLVVHNSIEQDADVVAFIYRAERYGITVDEHGNSTEGIAELILGKQRNGPVGTVQLAFVHQHARFENLTTYYAEPGGADMGDGFNPPQAPRPPVDEAPF